MSGKLLTEIKKQACLLKLEEGKTNRRDIDAFFNYAKSKNYQIYFHHGVEASTVFILVNPVLKHVEVLSYEPVNAFPDIPRLTIQEFFKKKAV